MKLTKKDEMLIEMATELAKANSDLYKSRGMHVGCVLLAKSGKIYKGINVKTSHSVCSEQVAFGQALAAGERALDTIVAVKLDNNGGARVVSPCGLCRYIFDKFDYGLNVIVEDIKNGTILKVKSSELLPYPYKREIDAGVTKEN